MLRMSTIDQADIFVAQYMNDISAGVDEDFDDYPYVFDVFDVLNLTAQNLADVFYG